MSTLFFVVLLFLVPLLIVGAYFAGQALQKDTPLRYRVSPLNVLAGFSLIGVTIVWATFENNAGTPTSFPMYFSVVVALLLVDLLLQLLIRSKSTFYITEAVLLAIPFLFYWVSRFF